jgi:hypothetical protein
MARHLLNWGCEMNERTAQSHGKEVKEYMYAVYCGYQFALANNENRLPAQALGHV